MSRCVLMTADAVGGVWTFALELARGLTSAGWSVALAVMGPPPSGSQRTEAGRIPELTLYERPCRLEWMDDPWDDVQAAGTWLLDLERRLEPGIIHLNGYCHGALPWRTPLLMTAHSCVLSWWRAVHGCAAPPAWTRYARTVERGLRAATLVTAPTAAMLTELQACYGALPRVQVIANGRAASWPGAAQVTGAPDRGPASPEVGTEPSGQQIREPMVLTAGRVWDAAKNVAALCAAAPGLPWPVYVAGDRGDACTTAENVHFLGRLSPAELAGWMRRASVFALPARYEPFGLSALEAALAGCALVVGDIPSLREVWGDAVVYVPPEDSRALTTAIAGLIADDRLRTQMAARAGARARHFTPERMVRGYEAAYRRITPAAAACGVQGSA